MGIALWVLLWLFYSFLFYYIMVFTVAVAASFWYYGVDKNYFTTAYKWIFTSSFGSLVFAALLIALITFARMLINDQRGRTRNIAAAVCLCIMSCLLKMIEDLVKVLNHNAVIVMSVTGESYVESAKTTIGILSRNLPLMTVATIITNLLVFWGVIIICGISSLFGVLFLENAPSD